MPKEAGPARSAELSGYTEGMIDGARLRGDYARRLPKPFAWVPRARDVCAALDKQGTAS